MDREDKSYIEAGMLSCSDMNEDMVDGKLIVYRVGQSEDFSNGLFFADSRDYYAGSATGYDVEKAKAFELDLSGAKVFDPRKEWGVTINSWSDIRQTQEFFDSVGLDGYEWLDEVDYEDPNSYHEVYTYTDEIAFWAKKHGYDAVIFEDIPQDIWDDGYTEYCVFNKSLVKPVGQPKLKEAKGNIRVGAEIAPAQAKEFYNRGYIDLVAVAPDGSEYVVPAWHSKEAQRQVSKEVAKKNGKDVEVIKGTKADIPSFEELLKDIEDAIGSNFRFITRSPEGNRTYPNEIEQDIEGRKTGKAYKLFKVINGKLYPPMVKNPGNKDTPVGVWIKCGVSEFEEISAGWGKPQVSGNALSFRPGWHLGDLPYAPQFESRTNPGYMSDSKFIWAECLYDATIDYQDRAMSYGYTKSGGFTNSAAGLPYRPEGGYYKYRTNPNPETIAWVITGSMKVNRLLSDKEVEAICKENGVPYLKRPGGDKTPKELGIQESIKEEFQPIANSTCTELYTENVHDIVDLFKVTKDAWRGINATGYGQYILQDAKGNKTHGDLARDAFKDGWITEDELEEINIWAGFVFFPKGYGKERLRYQTKLGVDGYKMLRKYPFGTVYVRFGDTFNDPLFDALGKPDAEASYDSFEHRLTVTKDGETKEYDTLTDIDGELESVLGESLTESYEDKTKDRDGREFRIWTESTGGYGDQSDYMMIAYVGDNWIGDDDKLISKNILGYLQYAEVEDSGEDDGIYIQMIEVKESERRKGIGTEMIKSLYRNNPGKDISWGFTTKDGTAFRNALKQRGEVNIEEGLGNSDEIMSFVYERLSDCIGYEPKEGPSYLLPDGRFLNLWDSGLEPTWSSISGKPTHRAVQKALNDNGLSSEDYYSVETPALEEIGCIRLNGGYEKYMWMPDKRPNESQWNSLWTWLDWYFQRNDELGIGYGTRYRTYSSKDYTVDELVKRLKAMYGNGRLPESCTGKIHEDSERDRLIDIANDIVEDSCDISKSPVGGSAYILRDGRFAYPRGMEHNEFEAYMQEENEELYDFGSGIMTSLLGAVQVNSGLYSTTSYLIVPKKLTREQGDAILDWYVNEGSMFNLVVHGIGNEPVLINKTGDGEDAEQLEALVKKAMSGANESFGRIDESKHDMGKFDLWELESPYQMRDFLIGQTEPMRVFIDQDGPVYLACKTYEATHSDMYNDYCTKGYADPSYIGKKRFASGNTATMDDFDPEQLCLIFVQNYDDVDFDEVGDAVYDDYTTCYEYPEYRIYAREYTSPFTHFDLYKAFGEPDNVRDISHRRDESLEEKIVRKGSKWQVQSEDGKKNLGTYDTKAEAEKRLKQVHYFKHVNESNGSLPDNYDEIISALEKAYKPTMEAEPNRGPSYLLRDGRFLYLDNLHVRAGTDAYYNNRSMHSDEREYLILKCGFDKHDVAEALNEYFRGSLDNNDGAYRAWETVIRIDSNTPPTPIQYQQLKKWVENIVYDPNGREYINVVAHSPNPASELGYGGRFITDRYQKYPLDGIDAEYIIDRIKKYYSIGRLVEGVRKNDLNEDSDEVYDFSKVHLTDEDKAELTRRYKKEFPNYSGFTGNSMYLLPDGTYLDLGDAHCNSEWVLEEFFQEKFGMDEFDAIEAVYRVEGGNIPENILGFVHVGSDRYNYIGIPKNELTSQQYNALNSYYNYHLDMQWGFSIEAYSNRDGFGDSSTWETGVYYDNDVGGFANRFGRKIDPNGLLKNFYRTGSFRMRESLNKNLD